MDTLADILAFKRAAPHANADLVREAADWLRAELDSIGQKYLFTDMAVDFFGYADFSIHCYWGGQRLTLELEIVEINDRPVAFAEIRPRLHGWRGQFPWYQEIASAEGRITLLHYVADFILSVSCRGEAEERSRA